MGDKEYPVETLRNNFESKCSMKIETNSRGYNTTVHCYEGVTKEQIEVTVKDTILAHKLLQEKLSELVTSGSTS